MHQLEELKITVCRDRESKEYRYNLRRSAIPGVAHDYSSMYLSRSEIETLLTGSWQRTFIDLNQCLYVIDETWFFYDINSVWLNKERSGTAKTPFHAVPMPRLAAKALWEIVEQATQDEYLRNGDEFEDVTIDILSKMAKFKHEYGHRTGTLAYDWDFEAANGVEAWRGEDTFDRSLDSLERIALNSTWQKSDVAKVSISKVRDEFYWRAGPLSGALINHGTEENPDWSIHT